MGFFDILKSLYGAAEKSFGGVNKPLKEALQEAPNRQGIFTINFNHKLVYVGNGERGINRALRNFVLSGPHSNEIRWNENLVRVSWQYCSSRELCRALAQKKIDEHQPEWN